MQIDAIGYHSVDQFCTTYLLINAYICLCPLDSLLNQLQHLTSSLIY